MFNRSPSPSQGGGVKYRDENVDGLVYPECTVDEDLDPMTLLKREIIRKLKEEKFYEDLNKRLDKSEYRVRKDQLFTRMQIEKNEKEYQDCLCKVERDKQRRREQICQEESFAKALRELKDEEVRESAFSKQLYACAPEIRELERQLRRGYCAKTLFAQRVENEALKLEDKRKDQETYQQLLEKMATEDAIAEEKRQRDWIKKKEYFQALTNQLEDATSKKAQKQEEYDRDKSMVDEIIATIEQEEIQDLVEKTEKVKLYQKEIGQFLQARDLHRERERHRIKEEQDQIQSYVKNKEIQVAEYKKAKAEQEKARNSMVAKAIERIMKDQYRLEEMEELRRELYEEELAADVRRREVEELSRKMKQMVELRNAAAEARKLREEKILAEKKEEEEYRQQLMGKFSEDERLEQMVTQKRRQREREHRKVVEQMIIDRRCLRAQERERDQKMLDCFDEETKRRQLIIEDERLKLLKKHGPKLLGFLPRGVIQSWGELEKLGEPFISYYKNQPLAPDPTTIDTEPCEEEIFKTMELPKYAKY
ncbi:meiosis-specific nuclear structural protein 1 [Folsomia candida]|uniref:meiosis-specific nuclear structural protein 1 n=1 Tax=Folsomia candida TaxID=158441 RepID=UPI00160511A5|nr:meiosis-specific nuclear structural protein 1 [Folsomia candida]